MQNSRLGLAKVVEDHKRLKKQKEQEKEQNQPEAQEQQVEQQPEEQAAKPKQVRKMVRLTDEQKNASESEKKTVLANVSPNEKKTHTEPPANTNDQTMGSRQALFSKVKKVVGTTKKPISQIRSPRPPTKKQKFEVTHHRFTNYLETDLYNTIQHLNKQGEIQSMTAVFNDAVYEYLATYFPEQLTK